MSTFHITKFSHLQERNKLLQASLRPEEPLFPIEEEYPTVLNKNFVGRSFCLSDHDQIIAHANLWMRHLINQNSGEQLKVGLIGNVASHEQFRGQGLAKKLLTKLETLSSKQGVTLLLLWSDLITFYQKMGFYAFGKEVRMQFTKSSVGEKEYDYRLVTPENIDDQMIISMLKLRFPSQVTLHRSMAEYRELLNIPHTFLFTYKKGESLLGFMILGKGYDMAGVIHEWGAEEPGILVGGISKLFSSTSLEEVTLLTPNDMPANWSDCFVLNVKSQNAFPVCLAKQVCGDVPDWAEKLFVWGLDSI